MCYIYVFQSDNGGKFHTGFTKNLKLRFDQHNKGLVGISFANEIRKNGKKGEEVWQLKVQGLL